jgi:protein-L-isoaspartate(D-aspartate) O-methyltransferase
MSGMNDFGRAREHMVDNQLRTSNITDWRILSQFSTVPREVFVAAERQSVAYIDDIQWFGETGKGRFMSAPTTLARLVQLGEITEADSVLDVGVASGYSTAIIAGLCGSVVGLESDGGLASSAAANIESLGIANARIVDGDLKAVGKGPFNAIIMEGALESVPPEYFSVLADGGRLVALIRKGPVAVATVFLKTGKGIASRPEFNASLPPLFQTKAEEQFVF